MAVTLINWISEIEHYEHNLHRAAMAKSNFTLFYFHSQIVLLNPTNRSPQMWDWPYLLRHAKRSPMLVCPWVANEKGQVRRYWRVLQLHPWLRGSGKVCELWRRIRVQVSERIIRRPMRSRYQWMYSWKGERFVNITCFLLSRPTRSLSNRELSSQLINSSKVNVPWTHIFWIIICSTGL